MAATPNADLFPNTRNAEGLQVLNQRCVVRTEDGYRVVIVGGVVLAQYALNDAMAEAHAMVSLVDQGWADQNDVARGLACSVRTLRRHQRRFEDGGLAALGHRGGYPRGRIRLASSRRRQVEQLKSLGHSQREIARRMGVSEKSVRKLLRRLGWKPAAVVQAEMALEAGPPATASPAVDPSALPQAAEPTEGADPNLSAFSSGTLAARSADSNPADRRGDRLLAYLGLLEDAAPLFSSGGNVPRAGVLLALPALIAGGVFACAHQTYGSLGPAFYGLRTSLRLPDLPDFAMRLNLE